MKRVIPAITFIDNSTYVTRQFKKRIDGGDLLNSIRFFSESDADELIVSFPNFNKSESNSLLIKSVIETCFVPLNIAGAVRDFESARQLFGLGLDKVSITLSTKNIQLMQEISEMYGAQALTAVVKINRNDDVNCSLLTEQLLESGAGEVLLIDIEKEGTGTGLDLSYLEKFKNFSLKMPLLVRGGCSRYTEINSILDLNWIDGIVAASIFSCTPDGESILLNYERGLWLDNDLQ